MGFGMTEILILAAIIIVFFGAKKIPEIAKGVGQGIKEFKQVSSDENYTDDSRS